MSRKLTRKGLVKKVDTVFQTWARKSAIKRFNNICPFCRKRPIENAFHWITRSDYPTRWDPDNITGSCVACNFDMEAHPLDYYQKYELWHGKERLEALRMKAKGIAKYSNEELEALYNTYKELLEKL